MLPHNETDTSIEAAESMEEKAPALRAQCLTHIVDQGGLTCSELEEMLNGRHQTISARVWELRQRGFIRDSGLRRKTASGRKAIVWEEDKDAS
jgi:predicted transcriptional regulator